MGKITAKKEVATGKLIPYARNAKQHSPEQVQKIADSIREFGFLNPVLVDQDNNIIAGHGRVLAAQQLGLEKVPCVYIEGLTDEQRRAYILADNRLSELGTWDMDLVYEELGSMEDVEIDLTGFDLDFETSGWFENHESGRDTEGESDEYKEFVEKFEPKKTTDDCYTPQNVYDAVADWVAAEYGVDREKFMRPFYPGGDYQAELYPPGCVVVDNPPFSILAEICRFYVDKGIKFFLFAPALTLFSADVPEICHICAGCSVTYENGAVVNTGFKTNLEKGVAVRTAPELTKAVRAADKENTKSDANLLKYSYPWNVITAAKVSNWGGCWDQLQRPAKQG